MIAEYRIKPHAPSLWKFAANSFNFHVLRLQARRGIYGYPIANS